MVDKLQPVRGTKDIFFEEYEKFAFVSDLAWQVAKRFGFSRISTPIFEFSDVFKRTLGDASDIVNKEMYSFTDRGGEEITLRPEFTAAISRAFISNGLMQHVPVKFFATGPLFRYERPQKGRMRQFHQINFEVIGDETYYADVEVLSLCSILLDELGILDKTVLEVNSMGDPETRSKYREALVAYFSKYVSDLSEDSKIRLEKNPLRILDSKDEGDKKLVAEAPLINKYYSDDAKLFFENLIKSLDALKIKYKINPLLVRGLDYYDHSCFEFTTNLLGSQNAVLAGGRYNRLVEAMGGNKVGAIGFAGGVERIMMLMDYKNDSIRPVAVMPIGDVVIQSMQLCHELREKNIAVEFLSNGNLGKRMKKASALNCRHVVILGEDEVRTGKYKVKDFDSGEEIMLDILCISEHLLKNRNI